MIEKKKKQNLTKNSNKPPCFGSFTFLPECRHCSVRIECIDVFNKSNELKFGVLPIPTESEKKDAIQIIDPTDVLTNGYRNTKVFNELSSILTRQGFEKKDDKLWLFDGFKKLKLEVERADLAVVRLNIRFIPMSLVKKVRNVQKILVKNGRKKEGVRLESTGEELLSLEQNLMQILKKYWEAISVEPNL